MDPAWWIDALRSPDGERLLGELAAEPPSVDEEVRVITKLRARYPAELVTEALTQTHLRQRARAKFTRADAMFFTRAGLEQASSERMAAHHAERFAPFGRVADLCSGIGGDLIALAASHRVLAVDRDPVHSRLGRVNAEANGVAANVDAVCADVNDVSLDGADAVFIDPARRADERRLRAGASEPPLEWCFAVGAAGTPIGIKAAPGLPLEIVPSDWEVEFVSEDRELKESVLWSPQLRTARRRATLLPSGETLVERDGASLAVRPPSAYLIDPDPAVTRAGLVEELGETIGGCWKIDEQVAFLSSDAEVRTAWARTLRIEASFPWSLGRLKEALRSLGVTSVDIRKRGSAVDVEDLQRRLRLKGSGRGGTVVLTRVADRPWAFVCGADFRRGRP